MNLRFILCSKRGLTFGIHLFPLAVFCQNWVLCYTIYFSSKDGAENHLMVCFFPESFSFFGVKYITLISIRFFWTVGFFLDETVLCIVSPVTKVPAVSFKTI